MGAGAALLAGDPGVQRALRAAGWAPTVERVAGVDPDAPEIARQFELLRELARHVRRAVNRGAFPLVLAGGCLTAAATVAGARPGGGGALGVVWLDAHADLDTPDDNASGLLDVMALSVLTGACWGAQAARIDGFRPVAEDDVALVGARDLAPYQRARLAASGVRTGAGAIPSLPRRRYLHVDLDVVDAREARMNRYAALGGPSTREVLEAVDAAFDGGEVVAACLSAYDPAADRDGAGLAFAREVVARVAARARAALRPG